MTIKLIAILLIAIAWGIAIKYVLIQKAKFSLKYEEFFEIVEDLISRNTEYAKTIRHLSEIVEGGNIHALTVITPEVTKKCSDYNYHLGSITDKLNQMIKERKV